MLPSLKTFFKYNTQLYAEVTEEVYHDAHIPGMKINEKMYPIMKKEALILEALLITSTENQEESVYLEKEKNDYIEYIRDLTIDLKTLKRNTSLKLKSIQDNSEMIIDNSNADHNSIPKIFSSYSTESGKIVEEFLHNINNWQEDHYKGFHRKAD